MAAKRFTVTYAGDEYKADNWKDLLGLFRKAAYPLVMRALTVSDHKTKKSKTFIVRRDKGRARIVRDGGRSVMPKFGGDHA